MYHVANELTCFAAGDIPFWKGSLVLGTGVGGVFVALGLVALGVWVTTRAVDILDSHQSGKKQS